MIDEKYVRILSSAGHAIDIDLKYLLLADETFISFEFDFDWRHHSESCDDCGALINTITSEVNELTWYAFFGGKFKLIDFFRSGDANDPEQGYLSFSTRSSNFEERGKYSKQNEPLDITKLRLTLLPIDPAALEPHKYISEYYGNTNRCDYLSRAQRQN